MCVYCFAMGNVTQVAFQLDNDSLAAVDALAEHVATSRAEVLRIAVRELLARRREALIDEQLASGYGVTALGDEQVLQADRSVEGLSAADLDW